jgi:hypothetical protein
LKRCVVMSRASKMPLTMLLLRVVMARMIPAETVSEGLQEHFEFVTQMVVCHCALNGAHPIHIV